MHRKGTHPPPLLTTRPLTHRPRPFAFYLLPASSYSRFQLPYLCFHVSYNGLQFGQNLLLSRWVDELEAGADDTPVRTNAGCAFPWPKAPSSARFSKHTRAWDARGAYSADREEEKARAGVDKFKVLTSICCFAPRLFFRPPRVRPDRAGNVAVRRHQLCGNRRGVLQVRRRCRLCVCVCVCAFFF